MLTPHEGELGRLLERGSEEVAHHRLACVREAAERGAFDNLPGAGKPIPDLDKPHEEVARHRLACAREAAEHSGAVVLLKGDDTIVALPGGEVAVNPGGTPALATAGTGDVLSGLIGALLAKGLEAFEAACLGALAHVLAAHAAAQRHGADHVMAGDVIDALPYGLTLR